MLLYVILSLVTRSHNTEQRSLSTSEALGRYRETYLEAYASYLDLTKVAATRKLERALTARNYAFFRVPGYLLAMYVTGDSPTAGLPRQSAAPLDLIRDVYSERVHVPVGIEQVRFGPDIVDIDLTTIDTELRVRGLPRIIIAAPPKPGGFDRDAHFMLEPDNPRFNIGHQVTPKPIPLTAQIIDDLNTWLRESTLRGAVDKERGDFAELVLGRKPTYPKTDLP